MKRRRDSRFISMTRQSILGFALLLAVLIVLPASADLITTNAPQDLGTMLQSVLTRHRVPGLAAVVLDGDQIVAEGVAGVRKAGAAERLTIDDQFLLCSGTKAMTATLAARAVEEGKLA